MTERRRSNRHRLQLAERGVGLNDNGGFYRRGKICGIETKLRVAAAYNDTRDNGDGQRESIDTIAKDCGVG